MKQIIKLNSFAILTILAIASLLLSSCSSKTSIIKRHYNKGYYIESKFVKPVDAKKQKQGLIRENNLKDSDQSLVSIKKKSSTNTFNRETQGHKNSVINSGKIASHKKKIIPRDSKYSSEKSNGITAVKKPTKINEVFFNTKKVFKNSIPEGSLSLFWIVVIIILVLWVLGFSSGGWGLGGLIHLLLLIALILLILWLLKVI